jgi:hypothetical protein
MRRVSVSYAILWAKVLQNLPVSLALRLPRCRFRLPRCAAALLPCLRP